MKFELPAALSLSLADANASLFQRINTFSRETLAVLSGLVNRQEVLEVEYVGDSGIMRLRPKRVRGRPKALCVGGVWVADTAAGVAGVTPAWRWEEPDVVVESFAGLSGGVRYRVSLLLVAD